MDLFITDKLELPKMWMIRQLFKVPPAVDVTVEVENEWQRIRGSIVFPDGKNIAIGVGSRGIANLTGLCSAAGSQPECTY